jgi:hypothetical protein
MKAAWQCIVDERGRARRGGGVSGDQCWHWRCYDRPCLEVTPLTCNNRFNSLADDNDNSSGRASEMDTMSASQTFPSQRETRLDPARKTWSASLHQLRPLPQAYFPLTGLDSSLGQPQGRIPAGAAKRSLSSTCHHPCHRPFPFASRKLHPR